jgi:hypothetical protein
MLSANDRFRVIHDQTPQTEALLAGANGDALDVPRDECLTAIAQGASHHLGVSQQCVTSGDQHVHAVRTMQPIMGAETFLALIAKCVVIWW